jgi:hypothetical protein
MLRQTAYQVLRRAQRVEPDPRLLGTPYPDIVAHVGRLLRKLPGYPELVIDCTGVGRPIFEMFVYSGISPIGVVITAGNTETRDGMSAMCQSSRWSAVCRRCWHGLHPAVVAA